MKKFDLVSQDHEEIMAPVLLPTLIAHYHCHDSLGESITKYFKACMCSSVSALGLVNVCS